MVNVSFMNLKLIKENSGRYDINKKISSDKDAFKAFEELFNASALAEERLFMTSLNVKNIITGAFTVSQGSLNSSLVHPREVFKRALMNNAASIIIAHNHPSGDSAPSNEDINITRRLKKCGKLLGVELLDHIIIGDNKYTSLKEKGIL